MRYILIDLFNDTINIVCKEDDSGDNLILDSLAEAKIAKEEYCQNGIIVPLTDTISVIKECSDFIDGVKLTFGDEFDNNGELKHKVWQLLE